MCALAGARALIFSPTAGGLPTLDSVDLSLLGAQAQAKASKPLAHKNVALTKVSAVVCMLTACLMSSASCVTCSVALVCGPGRRMTTRFPRF